MNNRPKYLSDNIPFYSKFPRGYNLDVDYSILPKLLNFDFHTLNGILPLTTSRYDFIGKNGSVNGNEGSVVFVNPLPEEYDYFESIGVKEFQAVSIVVHFYAVEEIDPNVLRGKPYSVSLVPMSRYGEIDTWNINLLRQFDLEELCQRGGNVFTEFVPFEEWKNGLAMDYQLFSQMDSTEFTDSIGFEWGMYFIFPVFNKSEILIPENHTYSKSINKKYKQYKANRYFKPFENILPRQVWGCGSPIELFLLQGLYTKGVIPEIQTSFYRSGDIFPNYYKMAEQEIFLPEDRLITAADFYYPKQKLALFCDGSEFHDSEKDKKIDAALGDLGIKTLRFSGKRITEQLEQVLTEIVSVL